MAEAKVMRSGCILGIFGRSKDLLMDLDVGCKGERRQTCPQSVESK